MGMIIFPCFKLNMSSIISVHEKDKIESPVWNHMLLFYVIFINCEQRKQSPSTLFCNSLSRE